MSAPALRAVRPRRDGVQDRARRGCGSVRHARGGGRRALPRWDGDRRRPDRGTARGPEGGGAVERRHNESPGSSRAFLGDLALKSGRPSRRAPLPPSTPALRRAATPARSPAAVARARALGPSIPWWRRQLAGLRSLPHISHAGASIAVLANVHVAHAHVGRAGALVLLLRRRRADGRGSRRRPRAPSCWRMECSSVAAGSCAPCTRGPAARPPPRSLVTVAEWCRTSSSSAVARARRSAASEGAAGGSEP